MNLELLAVLGLAAVFFVLLLRAKRADVRISGPEARARVAAGALLIDVRTPIEYRQGGLDGAQNIPLRALDVALDELDPERPIVVYCRSGARSSTAASLLLRDGRASVSSGEPFTPPMATRTPRGSATTRRGDAVSATEETRRSRSDHPSPVAPLP